MKNWFYIFSLSNFIIAILCILFFSSGLFFIWLGFPIITAVTTLLINIKKKKYE